MENERQKSIYEKRFGESAKWIDIFLNRYRKMIEEPNYEKAKANFKKLWKNEHKYNRFGLDIPDRPEIHNFDEPGVCPECGEQPHISGCSFIFCKTHFCEIA